MDDSILNSVKTKLNVTPDNTEFDDQLIDYINGAFGTLHQIGLGPLQGFAIEDSSATWTSFTGGDLRLNAVKTYVAQSVRMAFDPPQAGPAIQAMKDSILELTFRLNLVREEVVYGAPLYPPTDNGGGLPATGGVIDGGGVVLPTGSSNIIVVDGGKP